MNKSEHVQKRFADVYGSAGERPRLIGPLRVLWPLIPVCVAAGWLLHAALPFPRLTTSQAGFLLILLAAVLAFFATWSARRLRSFLKGAHGEETVARVLSFLPAGFSVFNDLHLHSPSASMDHVVASPSGIYVIETKNWSGSVTFENGRVLCNGRIPDRPPLKQSKELASSLADYLVATGCPEVPVFPVVCFVGTSLPPGPVVNIGGVRVCREEELSELFDNSLASPLPSGTLKMVVSELARCVENYSDPTEGEK